MAVVAFLIFLPISGDELILCMIISLAELQVIGFLIGIIKSNILVAQLVVKHLIIRLVVISV